MIQAHNNVSTAYAYIQEEVTNLFAYLKENRMGEYKEKLAAMTKLVKNPPKKIVFNPVSLTATPMAGQSAQYTTLDDTTQFYIDESANLSAEMARRYNELRSHRLEQDRNTLVRDLQGNDRPRTGTTTSPSHSIMDNPF